MKTNEYLLYLPADEIKHIFTDYQDKPKLLDLLYSEYCIRAADLIKNEFQINVKVANKKRTPIDEVRDEMDGYISSDEIDNFIFDKTRSLEFLTSVVEAAENKHNSNSSSNKN